MYTKISPPQTSLRNKVSKLTNHKLVILIEEISEFKRTGKLQDNSKLERLYNEISKDCPIPDDFRILEDVVLFEATRRFHNSFMEHRFYLSSDEVEDYSALNSGKDIYYVDVENQTIDHGKIQYIEASNGMIESIGVDFEELSDFDEFLGNALGTILFLDKSAAEEALADWQ